MIRKELFANERSMRAFEYGIKKAYKLKEKILKMNEAILMFDDEFLFNPKIDVCLKTPSISINVHNRESNTHYTQTLCGSEYDPVNGGVYSTKKSIDEVFKRISIFKKVY